MLIVYKDSICKCKLFKVDIVYPSKTNLNIKGDGGGEFVSGF